MRFAIINADNVVVDQADSYIAALSIVDALQRSTRQPHTIDKTDSVVIDLRDHAHADH